MLISNSCIASWITTRILNREIDSPLAWATIDPVSMSNLVENFYDIDFSKYKIEKYRNNTFSVIIDGKVRVNYVHYKKDLKQKTPKVIKTDVFYSKIEEFILQKYASRLSKFNKDSEPIFIIGFPSNAESEANYTPDDVHNIISHNKHGFKIITCIDKCSEGSEVIPFPHGKFKDNGIDFSRYIYTNSKILKSYGSK